MNWKQSSFRDRLFGVFDGRRRTCFAQASDALLTTAEKPVRDSDSAAAVHRFPDFPVEGDGFDPDLAGELALVTLLRQAGESVGPDPATRARIRQRVLDAWQAELRPDTGADTAEGVVREEAAPAVVPPTGAGEDTARPAGCRPLRTRCRVRVGGARGRLVVSMAATLCLLLSLSGMSVLLSRDALPGDTLYAVKRSAEGASLGLTFDEGSRAVKYLEFAADRLGELEVLAARAPGDEQHADAYRTGLADFDEDTTAGARALTALGSNGDTRWLEMLRDWSWEQHRRLVALTPVLPGSVGERAETTAELLTQVQARAEALLARTDCLTVTSGVTDHLGVRPAEEPCRGPQPPEADQPEVLSQPGGVQTEAVRPPVAATPEPPVAEPAQPQHPRSRLEIQAPMVPRISGMPLPSVGPLPEGRDVLVDPGSGPPAITLPPPLPLPLPRIVLPGVLHPTPGG